MRKYGGFDRKFGVTNRKFAEIEPQRLCEAWRRMYPACTAKNVAADLGASAKTVENWLCGPSVPSFFWTGRIIAAYGPEFLAEVMTHPPDWLIAAKHNAERERIAREIQELQHKLDSAAP